PSSGLISSGLSRLRQALCVGQGQSKNEGCAVAQLCLDRNLSTPGFDDTLDDRKTETSTHDVARPLCAIKRLECALRFLRQHAQTVVGDLQFVAFSSDASRDADVRVDLVAAIFHAVFNEVPERLQKQPLVVADGGGLHALAKGRV